MTLTYAKHEKLTLKTHKQFNEAWLQERIADDPSVLGLGEVRVLDRERSLTGGGRLDMLLLDEDNARRYEVELQLGATDPSHIVRTIEYWDLERRRYPGYDHVAVLVAEDVTTRFLNVLGLLSGSIPIIAIQLDAIQVGEMIVLNFVQVLDQTDLRTDDTDEDSGGGQVDRAYWERRVGVALLKLCDDVAGVINAVSRAPQEMNYMRNYIGLRSNGVVRNFVSLSPKRTKNITHVSFLNENAKEWLDRFQASGVPVRSRRKNRFRITITPSEFVEHRELIASAIRDTVKQYEADD